MASHILSFALLLLAYQNITELCQISIILLWNSSCVLYKAVGNIKFLVYFFQNFRNARLLNSSLAFFLNDIISLMDRGFVLMLLRNYMKEVSLHYGTCSLQSLQVH